MSSIVIFGKAHSGKSTLIGYLLTKSKNYKTDKLEYLEKTFRKQLGVNYRPSDFYRYIVDVNKDERVKSKKDKLGATIDYHIRKIKLPEIGEITVIDTPGDEHREKNKLRGMYYADVGVFCIEMQDVISDDFYTPGKHYSLMLSSLMLWMAFKKKKIIVALTKADLCGFCFDDYNKAKERIFRLCADVSINVKIIPISIDVDNRLAHNLLEKSSFFSWYNGETLCEALVSDVKIIKNENDERLFFCIDRQIKNPTSSVGKVWRIKVISGKIRQNDEIVLSPVINSNKQFMSITAKVKTIRSDNYKGEEQEELEIASEGGFFGIDLKDIKMNGRTVGKEDFNTIFTTCGFYAYSKYEMSKYFQFRITKEYSNKFRINRQFSLIWFGHPINFKVLDIIYENDEILVNSEIQTRMLSLPIDDLGNYYYHSIIIRDSNTPVSEPFDASFVKILKEEEVRK